MANINIFNKQRLLKIYQEPLSALVSFVLKEQNCPADAEVNLMYVRDKVIRHYNLEFLHHDYATDVISFAAQEEPLSDNQMVAVGDIMVSTDTALNYALENKLEVSQELARYTVHGILHCLGFDDKSLPARQKMFTVQESILKRWFNNNPEPICDTFTKK